MKSANAQGDTRVSPAKIVPLDTQGLNRVSTLEPANPANAMENRAHAIQRQESAQDAGTTRLEKDVNNVFQVMSGTLREAAGQAGKPVFRVGSVPVTQGEVWDQHADKPASVIAEETWREEIATDASLVRLALAWTNKTDAWSATAQESLISATRLDCSGQL